MQPSANSAGSGFHRELAETLERLSERFDEEVRIARRGQSEHLNQIVRRLRDAEGEKAWSAAVVDGASAFAARCFVSAIEGDRIRVLAWRGIASQDAPAPVTVSAARAFRSVVESSEPVVALRNAGEMSDVLQQFIEDPPGGTAHLFPVVSSGRVAAIVYADSASGEVDSSSIEILISAASASLPGANTSKWKQPEALVELQPGAKSWDSLPPAEQQIHLRAQRMARSRVANLLLYRYAAVTEGRAAHDLFGSLEEEIRAGRDEFRRSFLETCGSMVDYFHLELLNKVANHDAELLGPDYPGPMAPGASIPDRVA